MNTMQHNSPIERLLSATNRGLDIITMYYPDAARCTDGRHKFKIRTSERTPSASLRLFGDVWKVTDFGGDGKAKSGLDIAMKRENLALTDTIGFLCRKFGVAEYSNLPNTNRADSIKPLIEILPTDNAHNLGERVFEFNASFSDAELKLLGPKVTQEHCEEMGWHPVKSIIHYKKDKTVKKRATTAYPIFVRECRIKGGLSFYKIYEPLCEDKRWRFSYYPEGVKPREYVNGLDLLESAYEKYNADPERQFRSQEENTEAEYHPKKLPAAILCSGERDALCVRSLGYYPLWLNSETAELTEATMEKIMHLVDTLYNIPDIDQTGIRQGSALALRHIDIHTVWLHEELRNTTDRRGNPCKDFRDWSELNALHIKSQFKRLLDLATPARFWCERRSKRTGDTTYYLDINCLLNFLQLNGFYTLKDEHSKDVRFIRIVGNIVKEVTTTDITNFIKLWAENRGLQREVRNLIINTPKISARSLAYLREREIDFSSATPSSQLFFFEKGAVRVDEHSIEELSAVDSYVWDRNVIRHPFRRLDDMFEITPSADNRFRIKVKSVESHIFGYLIYSSRIHWQKESLLEKFVIDSPTLSAEDVAEQMQCLVNKIFTIGYMLHRYKSPSRAWAPQAMDYKIDETGECNGRSGKSFMFKMLSLFLNTIKLSGRNPRLMENPHIFGTVTEDTDLILVDDCDRSIRANMFYDNITGDMTVNPKNVQAYNIPFERFPKFAFTTNYVPTDFDPSSEARLLYVVFGNYYHQKTEENEYTESRSIRDDFGKDLFTRQYIESEWNADINFLLQCCRFYLSLCDTSIKPLPPMRNIIIRKHIEEMGDNFQDWAEIYFAEGSENLNREISRTAAFENYKEFSGVKKITMQTFTKKLRAFCSLCPYIEAYNPENKCGTNGRIIRKVDNTSVEMIYIKSKPTIPKNEPHNVTQQTLPVDVPIQQQQSGECQF